MVNKVIGNSTEQEFLKILKELRYWCYLTPDKVNGQPCDVIAIRDNVGWLLDVKHCNDNRFDFTRIEPNQLMCFEYNRILGNNNTGFALYFQRKCIWKILRYDVYCKYLRQGASVNADSEYLEDLCVLE